MDPSTARRMWLASEPLHAVTYFAPESFAAWEASGLRGFWRGYFATRAAPLGAVGPAPVIATFFNFAPSMVRQALPSVWQLVSPDAALAARSVGAADALRRVLDTATTSPSVQRSADLTRRAVDACSPAGRALFAANAELPWPDDSLAALWHGITCLREHRGDGHNAVLIGAGLDGCEAHVLAAAVNAGGAARAARQPARGWTDEDWAAAEDRLSVRGLVAAGGSTTRAGARLHAQIEEHTDTIALAPWSALGPGATEELAAILRPLADAVIASEVLRFPNPMGLPAS